MIEWLNSLPPWQAGSIGIGAGVVLVVSWFFIVEGIRQWIFYHQHRS